LKKATGTLKGWKIHPEAHGNTFPIVLKQADTLWDMIEVLKFKTRPSVILYYD
jgi:hypothetical protein